MASHIRRQRYNFRIRTTGKAPGAPTHEFTSFVFAANEDEARRHVEKFLANVAGSVTAECIEPPRLAAETT